MSSRSATGPSSSCDTVSCTTSTTTPRSSPRTQCCSAGGDGRGAPRRRLRARAVGRPDPCAAEPTSSPSDSSAVADAREDLYRGRGSAWRTGQRRAPALGREPGRLRNGAPVRGGSAAPGRTGVDARCRIGGRLRDPPLPVRRHAAPPVRPATRARGGDRHRPHRPFRRRSTRRTVRDLDRDVRRARRRGTTPHRVPPAGTAGASAHLRPHARLQPAGRPAAGGDRVGARADLSGLGALHRRRLLHRCRGCANPRRLRGHRSAHRGRAPHRERTHLGRLELRACLGLGALGGPVGP